MNLILTVLVLLAPVGLIYGWVCYFTPIPTEPTGWRSRATLLSLTLVSLAGLLWLFTMINPPDANWATGAGVGHQLAWVYARARFGLAGLLLAFLISLFGRPRLILPITVACVGAGVFWIVSTMP